MKVRIVCGSADEPADRLLDEAFDDLAALRRRVGDSMTTVPFSSAIGDDAVLARRLLGRRARRSRRLNSTALVSAADARPTPRRSPTARSCAAHAEAAERRCRRTAAASPLACCSASARLLGGHLLAVDEQLAHLHALGAGSGFDLDALLGRDGATAARRCVRSCAVLLEECHVPVSRSAVWRSLSSLVRRERAPRTRASPDLRYRRRRRRRVERHRGSAGLAASPEALALGAAKRRHGRDRAGSIAAGAGTGLARRTDSGRASRAGRSSSSSRSSCTAALTSISSVSRPSISRHADGLLVDLLVDVGDDAVEFDPDEHRLTDGADSCCLHLVDAPSRRPCRAARSARRAGRRARRAWFSSSSTRCDTAIIASSKPVPMRPTVASRLAIFVPLLFVDAVFHGEHAVGDLVSR